MQSKGLVFSSEKTLVLPDKLYDVSRHRNICTHTGTTPIKLPSGLWVWSLNGTSDFIDAGADTSLDALTRGYTIASWAMTTDITATKQMIFHKKVYDASLTDLYAQFNLELCRSTQKISLFVVSDGTSQFVGSGVSERANNTFVFLAGVCAIGYKAALYVNGNLEAQSPGVFVGIPYISTGPLRIGRHQDAANVDNWFKGVIALPRIYNYPLSASRIFQIFQQERSLFGM